MTTEQLQELIKRHMDGILQELASISADTEDMSEEAKMVYGEEDKEDILEEAMSMAGKEDMKALSEDKVVAIVARAALKHRSAKADNLKSIVAQEALKAARREPAPVQPMGAKSMNVQVSENLKYAHLTASEMALAVKVAMSGLNPMQRINAKAGALPVFGEDFFRHLAQKAMREMGSMGKYKDTIGLQDANAMKAAMPFKADELNASDITNQGLEWVEVFYDTNLWERARDRTELFNRLVNKGMRVIDIPRGASGMNVKLDTASGTVYTAPQANNVGADGRPEVVANITNFRTSEVQVDAKTHILAYGITFQLDEDSIIDAMRFADQDMVKTLSEALESAMVNGDTTTAANTNINIIDGTPSSGTTSPLYLAWDGIRKNFIVTNTTYRRDASATALTIEDYEATKVLLGSTIQNRTNEMLYVVDYKTYSQTRRLPELLTAGVALQGATIYVGDVPALFGVDVYQSGLLGLTNGDGKISTNTANNTKGTLMCVYAPYWQYGRKRNVIIEPVRNPMEQTTVLVASVRHAFTARGAAAVAGTFDLGV